MKVKIKTLQVALLTALIVLFSTSVHAATRTWTGATDTNWTLGSNWAVAAPVAGDAVLIPGGLTNYPVISTAVSVATISINSAGSGAKVTVTTGGSLTATGLITVNANGTFLMLGGTALLKGISSPGAINIQGGTITSDIDITVSGTLTQSGGTVWLAVNTSTNPSNNLVISGGTVTQSGGTIYTMDYSPTNGTFNQIGSGAILRIFRDWKPISGHTFNSSSGMVRFSGASGGTASFISTNTQFNSILVDAGINPGFSTNGSSLVKISGNFTNNNAALAVTTNATFTFNGAGAQSISGTSTSTAFGHLIVNKPGGILSLNNPISIAGNLTMTDGTFNPGASLLTIIGTFTSFTGGTIKVGASTFAGNYSKNPSPSAGTTVDYSASGNQTVSNSFSYSNLTISGSGTKTLAGNTTNNGVLKVSRGTALALSTFTLGPPSSIVLEWGLTGSSITGTGTLSLGGPVNVSYFSGGSMNASISCPFASGATRTFTIASDGATSASGLTVTGIISGPAFGITKAGAGTMVLSGANTYTGGTTITSGTLTLGTANRLADTGPVTLDGGTLRTGTTTGNSEIAGTLALTDNSTIALGTGSHTLTFAASNGIAWTSDKTITITGWTGSYNGTTGTSGKIFVGNNASGLTATQLSQIQFYNGANYYPAAILATGEVVAGGVITSVQSGNWSNPNTWDLAYVPVASDFVVIGPHTVTVNQDATITDINITSGGIIGGGKKLIITRNLTINGAITGSLQIDMIGTNTISGNGIVNAGDVTLIGGNKTITTGTIIDNSSASSLSTILINTGVTVFNNGSWVSGAKIIGADASSAWVQGVNSSLKAGNDLLSIGTLHASEPGNTIHYFEDGIGSIKTAVGAYYNLTISGADAKELSADIDINGTLNIISGTFDPKAHSINIAGNWINNSSFTENNCNVIFDGSGEQILSAAGGETFYNLQFNNSGSGIVSTDNILVTNALTLTAGIINMGASRITLGTSAANIGTLTHTTGYIIGELERWLTPGPTLYDFPVGTSLFKRTAVFKNDPGASAGSLIIKFVEKFPGNITTPPLVDGAVNLYNLFFEGYWDIQTANGLATGASGTSLFLTGNGFTSHTIGAQTRSVYRSNSAAAWAVTGIAAVNTGNEIRRSGIPSTTQSGQWALADNTNCTAPVTPVITGTTVVCKNDSGEIYSVTDNGDTYIWTVTGGSITAGQSTNSITVTWGAAGMVGSVVVVATNTCTSTYPVTLPIDIGPLPTSAVTGKFAVSDYTNDEPYSVVNKAGYTYNWTITGGTIAGGQGTNSITVNWAAAGAGNVSVIGSNGCGSAVAKDIDIHIYFFIESAESGNYKLGKTWVGGSIPVAEDFVRIMPSHAVTLGQDESNAMIDIKSSGTLNLDTHNYTVNGHVNIDGSLTGTGDLFLSGNNIDIDGVGSIQNTGNLIITMGGNTILSHAAFTKSNGNVIINNNLTLTNNGVLTLNGSLIGGNASSRFINEVNASLSISGTLFTTGTLISSANSNTVNYTGLINQTIYPTTYYNLGASGGGIKSLGANVDIKGELQISDNAILDVTALNYTINIAGNWRNTSINADPFVQRLSTVTLNGSTLQTITAAGGETFYNLIIKNTSAAGVTLLSPVAVSNLFTITQGIVRLGAANLIGDSSPIVLNGGTLSTGSTTGYTDIAGTLNLTENSTIALGTGVHSLTFAASNGLTWTSGKSLIITGWTGNYDGTSGTAGKIFVGNSATGLTSGQLSQILFYNGISYYQATILATGEVVATVMFREINTNAISGSPFCEGAAVSVSYSITGIFNAGNIFTAQLSDASGNFASPVSIGTLASTAAGTISGTIPSDTSAGTGYRIRVVSNNPAITGSPNGIDLTIIKNTWTGAASTDWNGSGNWSCGIVPDIATNAQIPVVANKPILSSGALGTVKNIIIDNGSSLTVINNTIQVSGTMTNNAGTTGLILQSDATGTAALIHNTNSVPATVQRYISGAAEAWHFLSSPVSNQAIAGSWIPAGTYGNGTGYDMYLWNEPTFCWIYQLNTTSDTNWTTTHPGADFTVGRGYLYSVQALNPIKEFVGSLNNGSLSYGLTVDAANASLNGFNLVGNPYPSSVDWVSASGWTRSNLVSSGTGYDMWIWNPAFNNYGVCNSSSGIVTNGISNYIAPMQGFFVQALSAGNLSMDNNIRVVNGAGNWFKNEKQETQNLSLVVKSDAGFGSDEVLLGFGYFENENGASKLFSNVVTAPSLYLSSESKNLSVRYLTNTRENAVVPVMFAAGTNGKYSISSKSDLSIYETVWLHDRQMDYLHDLKLSNTYTFQSSTSDAANRFVLYFEPLENYSNNQFPVRIYTDGLQLIADLTLIDKDTDVLVYNAMGELLLQKKLQGKTEHKLNLNANMQILIVYAKNPDGSLSQKLLWGLK